MPDYEVKATFIVSAPSIREADKLARELAASQLPPGARIVITGRKP